MDLYFKDGRDLIAYSHIDYSPLPERISQMLKSREKWEEMTRNAYAAVKADHTFLHRAQEILEVLHSGF
jgi:spore maturation protein CgeB